ncbi:aminomethyl-transferring glycine dehydrogenase [Blattabacterium cuenoti]|uniref:aminomethyl-transferring glycine dehydrogenase n=1 Tax=Blattabacterium cuenoti TaxID=1653831 RepID=UPI00163CBB80|nr:aminomethyl-transferring glycine dehydrogenase [Blattabacterium cuenoti]
MQQEIINQFSFRHIGPSCHEIKQMLQTLKCQSIQNLINKTIPKKLLFKKKLIIPNSISEYEYLNHINNIGKKNQIYKSYIGLGYKNTILPAVIKRNILENPNWYTPYTPYQSEISQGRLEALMNFQTMVSDITRMEISNASMLDEATASADAMFMLYQNKLRKEVVIKSSYYFFISIDIFPQTFAVVKTRCTGLGIKIIHDSYQCLTQYKNKNIFGMLLSYPSASGQLDNYTDIMKYAYKNNISTIITSDLLALTLLLPPGEWKYKPDVVVGSTQSFGLPMGYGGPHAAFFSTYKKYQRFIPGRIIGESIDNRNKKSFRMALQMREQHIKREKATSNICTSQVLTAIIASMYAIYHGSNGLKIIANKIHNYAKKLEILLLNNIHNISQKNLFYFDTIRIKIHNNNQFTLKDIKTIAEQKKTNFRYIPKKNQLTITLDETTSQQDISRILSIFYKASTTQTINFKYIKSNNNIIIPHKIPSYLKRTSGFLDYKIFKKYHKENELIRYIKRLENKDLSLTHSMIPLGSCTMKLNASAELYSISQNEWQNIHPFSPFNQTKGYNVIINNLGKYLKNITGLKGISLQPNSGAQGEYAGLMVIKSFHNSMNESHRNVALIPSSSHGTNPASAKMAGMKIVIINTTHNGSIDKNDFFEKIKKYKNVLSVLMITYPSTHGVYETNIIEILNTIHENGGQVYMDGANLNAQVGLIKPSDLGVDICHINLHKTFAIPHGGGGPGMGPICVASHLIPFLPNHPLDPIPKQLENNDHRLTISAAPYGSPLILTISYAYIRLLGPNGLKEATEIAILNANYIKEKIKKFYNILYVGDNNTVAHELILDCRPFKNINIEVIDIAKRMMDYGYHAPTISFPVHGCIMIEPTESESKEELDRFIETLISIRKEIDEIKFGIFSQKNNVLKNAPHPIDVFINEKWEYPYSKQKAAYPLNWIQKRKFWPSLSRINDAYGDRNLICHCT